MEKDMKFTTAAEWMRGQYAYDHSSGLLENFQLWWDMNSEERCEMGQEPLGRLAAMDLFCALHGGVSGITPNMILREYEKVVDTIA